MSFVSVSFILIAAYFAVMLLVGFLVSRKEDKNAYIIGNRNVGILGTSGSLAASFRDGGGIAFWIGMGVSGGYFGLWLFVGVALAALFFCLYAPRLRQDADHTGHLTVNECVRYRIGDITAKSSALVSMAFAICAISLQFYVSGSIFSSILQQPQWIGVLSVGLVVAVYMLLGGYKSVIFTDTLQFFLIISLLVSPFVLPPDPAEIVNFDSFVGLPAVDKLAFVVFGMFFLIAMPEAWQRVYSAKDSRTIRFALPLVVVYLILMSVSMVWLGMGVKAALGAETIAKYSESYLAIFDPALTISPFFQGYLCMVFLAITMSTQSASIYVFSSTVNRIFCRDTSAEDSDRLYIFRTRLIITVVILLTGGLSLLISDVVKTILDMMSFFICLAPVYMLAVANPRWLSVDRRVDWYVTSCLLIGIAIFLGLFFAGLTKAYFICYVIPALIVLALLAIIPFIGRKNPQG